MNELFATVAILTQGTYWANASLQAFRAWVRFAVFNSSVETKGDLCRGGFFFSRVESVSPSQIAFFGKRAACETNVLQQKVVTVRSGPVRSGPVGGLTVVIVIGDLRSL